MNVRRAVICSQSNFDTDYRVAKMAATLRSCGYEVTLLGRSHPREARAAAPGAHYMKMLFWHGPLFYAELNVRLLFHLLFCRRPALIVSIDLDTLAGCLAASKVRGARLMFDSHELFPEVPEIAGKPFVRRVWQRVQDFCVPRMRATDVRVTVCRSIADIFRSAYGREFLVVRNVPLAAQAEAVRHMTARAGRRPFTILYQGAVNVGRGVEEVIKALPRLPGCRFVVVGGGDVLEDARRLAEAEGVADRVEFAGRKPFGQLAQYMAAADLGTVLMRDVCLNYRLALPNRLFDFIQAGLPILASRLPEVERIVDGEGVGLCVGDLTPDAVAEAVRVVMAHPELAAHWRANMAALASRQTWEEETKGLVKTLAGQDA